MKKYKVFMVILLVVSMCFCVFVCPASAVSENMLYTECVTVEPGHIVKVPVFIENNTGLMGFSISIDYDGAVLTPVNVTRGQIINVGLFDDSIGTGDTDSFKVIWSSTENVYADGELFSVEFLASEDAPIGTYTILLSYEPRDTFNESWNNVAFSFGDAPSEIGIDIRLSSVCFFEELTTLAVLLIRISNLLVAACL